MTTAIQIPEILKEDEFDYKESKVKYCELINSTPHNLFTQKEYDNAVNNHVESPYTSHSLVHQASELHWDRDETGEIVKRPVLIMKRCGADGAIDFWAPKVRYLPVEHSFDVLMNIHMSTYHGGLAEMVHCVTDKVYTTNAIYLEFILLSCKVCVKNGLSFEPESDPNKQIIVGQLGKKGFNRIVELDIHAFERPQYDGNFKCLLIYHDRDTWFTLLRPLLARCYFEVATEMLKIITTFGFANKYAVSKRKLNFFLGIGERLNTIGLKLESTKIMESATYQSTHVLKLFMDWIKTTGFNNWGIGCHIFQSEFNNTTPKTFSDQSQTPTSLAFEGTIELPEKYKLHKRDISSKDFDVDKTAFDNVIQQTDSMTIHKYTTTETAVRKQFEQNTNREELQREVPLPQLVIKEEIPIEPCEEDEAGAVEYYFEISNIVDGEHND